MHVCGCHAPIYQTLPKHDSGCHPYYKLIIINIMVLCLYMAKKYLNAMHGGAKITCTAIDNRDS